METTFDLQQLDMEPLCDIGDGHDVPTTPSVPSFSSPSSPFSSSSFSKQSSLTALFQEEEETESDSESESDQPEHRKEQQSTVNHMKGAHTTNVRHEPKLIKAVFIISDFLHTSPCLETIDAYIKR